jgi:hypothetical protein
MEKTMEVDVLVKINIHDHELELTVEEVKELQKKLNEALPLSLNKLFPPFGDNTRLPSHLPKSPSYVGDFVRSPSIGDPRFPLFTVSDTSGFRPDEPIDQSK